MKAKRLLSIALFLSFSAHASVLYFVWNSKVNPDWIKPGQIQVSIERSEARQHPEINSVETHAKKFRSVSSNHESTVSQTARSQEITQPRSEDNLTASAENKLTVQLRGKIKTALQKHLTYPPLARRRGWQGTVTVQLTIRANGVFQHIQLAKSSGYSLLDDSAIEALKEVGQLAELGSLLNGKNVPIKLPITYLLEDAEYGAPPV